MPKARVAAFIDGFNMYHSLDENGLRQYKWLNYWALAEKFITASTEELTKVYYFSALAKWDTEKVARHQNYIKALRFVGVTPVMGNFKQVTRKCRECKRKYLTFEEKETDVNIAVYLTTMALRDEYDKALLFGADSDLIPAITTIQNLTPHKPIKVIFPFKRKSEHLRQTCIGETARIKIKHLQTSIFSDPLVIDAEKGVTLEKPPSWA